MNALPFIGVFLLTATGDSWEVFLIQGIGVLLMVFATKFEVTE